jgi:hypothetical protein
VKQLLNFDLSSAATYLSHSDSPSSIVSHGYRSQKEALVAR